MTVTTLPTLPSIQGEQQLEATGHTAATDDDADEYVENHSPEVLACREGVHPFPPMRKSEMPFTAIDDDGLYLREVECPSCGCATRVDYFEWVGGPKRGRMVFLTRKINYHPNRKTGERYLAPPGTGRIKKGQIRASMATQSMRDTSIAAVRKLLQRADAT